MLHVGVGTSFVFPGQTAPPQNTFFFKETFLGFLLILDIESLNPAESRREVKGALWGMFYSRGPRSSPVRTDLLS